MAFLFKKETFDKCTACNVETNFFWMIPSGWAAPNSIYCLACAFTKTAAEELHSKLRKTS